MMSNAVGQFFTSLKDFSHIKEANFLWPCAIHMPLGYSNTHFNMFQELNRWFETRL